MKKNYLKKEISQVEIVPPLYGVAYVDYLKNKAVCYPLGINLLVLLAREIKFWFKNPKGRY